mgnify:CR=1
MQAMMLVLLFLLAVARADAARDADDGDGATHRSQGANSLFDRRIFVSLIYVLQALR